MPGVLFVGLQDCATCGRCALMQPTSALTFPTTAFTACQALWHKNNTGGRGNRLVALKSTRLDTKKGYFEKTNQPIIA